MSPPDFVVPPNCDARIGRLHAYWCSLHPQPEALPGRQHLDPAAIPDLLPWLWMADVERPLLRFRYRLLGTQQVAVMEADFTGRWMDDVHPRFIGSTTYPQFIAAAESGAISYRTGSPLCNDHLSIERLLLPLARNGRDVDILLGITLYHRAA